jgi:transaldolase
VDTEVDKRLAAVGNDAASGLKGLAGIANARLAYELFEREFATDRAKALLDAGANVQRPLWASTGVKDPSLPDTLYVTELVAPGTVNTMPEKTLEATFDHGVIAGDAVTGAYAGAHEVFDKLAEAGVDVTDVTQVLEDEGVEKFIASWRELQATVAEALQAAQPAR